MENFWGAAISAGAIAIASGVTVLAFKHPRLFMALQARMWVSCALLAAFGAGALASDNSRLAWPCVGLGLGGLGYLFLLIKLNNELVDIGSQQKEAKPRSRKKRQDDHP